MTIKDDIINPPEHNGDPNCKFCFGKGYSSELTGISWGSDLGVGNPGRKDVLNMKPCKCVRKEEPADEPTQSPDRYKTGIEQVQLDQSKTTKLGWGEEFEGMELEDGLCPMCSGLASIGSDTIENCEDCRCPIIREELKAFILKVESEAKQKGIRECVEMLEDSIKEEYPELRIGMRHATYILKSLLLSDTNNAGL